MELWFEFGSTYSHLAVHRAQALSARAGVVLAYRVFLLGPIFKAQGWNDSPFNLYPAKGAYMWRDLERRCAKYGIAFKRPSQFPRNGLLAARVALAAESEVWLGDFVRAVFRANFGEDTDISAPETVHALLGRSGCADPALWIERANSSENKERLRQRTETAVARGIFGAPSFVVGDELFWGDDRLEDALEWCARP